MVKDVDFRVKPPGYISDFVPILSWVPLGEVAHSCQPQFSHLQMEMMTAFTLQGYLFIFRISLWYSHIIYNILSYPYLTAQFSGTKDIPIAVQLPPSSILKMK